MTDIVVVEHMGGVMSTPKLFSGEDEAEVVVAAERHFHAVCRENGVGEEDLEACAGRGIAERGDWSVSISWPEVERVG